MRWRNLADKQPKWVSHMESYGQIIIRKADNKVQESPDEVDYILNKLLPASYHIYEWLDETAPEIDVPPGFELKIVPEGAFVVDPYSIEEGTVITPKGVRNEEKWARELLAEEIEKGLEDQHRATLKQVEDYIEPHWTLTDPYRTHRQQIQEVLRNINRDVE